MTTTSVPNPTIARISEAAGLLARALHEIRMAVIAEESGAVDPAVVELLNAVKGSIWAALGTEKNQGIMDLLGMRLIDNWLDAAFLDGHYDGIAIYRFDGEPCPIFSARELSDDDGVSYWHFSEQTAAAHLIQKCGARPGQPFEPIDKTRTGTGA